MLTNYGESDVPAALTLDFGADFVDIFEVRGYARAARGRILAPDVARDGVLMRYEGMDNIVRASQVSFSQPPTGSPLRAPSSIRCCRAERSSRCTSKSDPI